MERSYADRADGATNFDPEMQFEKDIEEASISKEILELAELRDNLATNITLLLHHKAMLLRLVDTALQKAKS